ncbi:MAG: hypothetical protein NZ742_04180, partial [Acidobacteria bacterium]|nr:hypothetical protein [Acidobacteriota bacterium]MDW7984386.1 hypothetical protein [Acidobacteriota bacterium]
LWVLLLAFIVGSPVRFPKTNRHMAYQLLLQSWQTVSRQAFQVRFRGFAGLNDRLHVVWGEVLTRQGRVVRLSVDGEPALSAEKKRSIADPIRQFFEAYGTSRPEPAPHFEGWIVPESDFMPQLYFPVFPPGELADRSSLALEDLHLWLSPGGLPLQVAFQAADRQTYILFIEWRSTDETTLGPL